MMSNEVKQRKKGSSGKDVKDAQQSAPSSGQRARKSDPDSSVSGSGGVDVRTLLCLICVAACGALTWLVYQQSQNFSILETKYQSLQTRSGALEELEDKIKLIFGKLQETEEAVMKLKALEISQHAQQLQKDMANIKTWSKSVSEKRDQLEGNITSLQEAIAKIENSASAIAKDVSMKINGVKTDVRRISGLDSDISLLAESVNELERKLEKLEKSTIQSIGDALVGSIDRITELKNSVNTNSDRIDAIKKRLSELRSNFGNNSEKLQNLESDRLRVIQAVHFANDLKPKVFTLRKDLSRLESTLNDLFLRIGTLANDLLGREREIAAISDKMHNLTIVRSEILDLNTKIGDEL
ncbi:inhibitor of nuclear factor kappa-B kinase-interacting protein isoform X2 [Spea bombifrons]|uniref:inhibitor of nuclear factor kappa-B kinase-interacting protein isoform X2 n=1 Tax=Spea bombifrons TaxID=233779 RepID=UPI00234B3252|nr:inhibitor of nuclear factor kappa-B kinase-interacting protein isoform X2 [Spea bombifrons]